MIIHNNLASLSAYNSLEATNKSLQKSIEKLSTGMRINDASDDAAGFAIGNKMRTQIFGLDRAKSNARDGISLLETAEGALGATNSMLQRMRELAIQASNDSLTSQDRSYIQLEIDEIKKNINRISGNTQFNNKRLLDGSSGALWSSNDLNVNVKINGGLTGIDEFGQKISSEGNYRIEVTAEPGQAQVQKSNIFNLEYSEEIIRTELVTVPGVTEPGNPDTPEEPTIINLSTLEDGDSGEGWEFKNRLLTINSEGNFNIKGDGNELTDRTIKINGNVNAKIILTDVNISSNITSPFDIDTGGTIDMYLKGDNKFTSTCFGRAGLEVTEGSTITINSASGDGSDDGKLNVTGAYYAAGIGGSMTRLTGGNITIKGGTIVTQGGNQCAGIGGACFGGAGNVIITGGTITATGGVQGAGIGSGHFAADNPDTVITITGGNIKAYGGSASDDLNAAGIGGACHSDSGTIRIKKGLVTWKDEENGMVDPSSQVFAQRGAPTAAYPYPNSSQDIGHGTDSSGEHNNIDPDPEPSLPSPIRKIPVEITDVIVKPGTLRNIKAFYTHDGTFLVNKPQTITITQGDGKTARVTLYSTDSLYDVAEKINDAISNSLEQCNYVDSKNKFCTIADGTNNSSESVCTFEDVYRRAYKRNENGELELDENHNPIEIGREISGKQLTNSTMLIRSAIPGKSGELHFSCDDEDLLNALGLNTIQESSESTFTASVYEAHSGIPIAKDVKATESEFKGIIPPEIDIQVDHMAGLSASWDENTKKFMLAQSKVYNAMIHLKDNGIVFQTGANRGEDFLIQLGDSSTRALGIEEVSVISRKNASRAISVIDKAINKISTQRAKIGAYENSLEHTIENLDTTTLNLISAESRITDVDMAQEMMNFVKYQILNQSGNSMLAQANQLPQSVLSLLG